MPQIDLTITISVLLALCAIISPVITAIINNLHDTKIKKLELKQKQYEDTVVYKRTLFQDYLKFAGKCIARSDASSLREYGETYLLVLMYSPSELHPEMIKIHQLLTEYQWDDAAHKFESLIPKINKLLQQL